MQSYVNVYRWQHQTGQTADCMYVHFMHIFCDTQFEGPLVIDVIPYRTKLSKEYFYTKLKGCAPMKHSHTHTTASEVQCDQSSEIASGLQGACAKCCQSHHLCKLITILLPKELKFAFHNTLLKTLLSSNYQPMTLAPSEPPLL